MRRAAKKDANHNQLCERATQVGAQVFETWQIPGLLDAIIGYRGVLHWIEIKDGAKPPSERRLTSAEQTTIERLQAVGCPVHVVLSEDELLKAIGAIK